MKIWTSDHTFEHPWETVVSAAWQKYPNPHNPAVIATDVVDRTVDKGGVLCTHRLLSTTWGLPAWASNLIGMDRVCYASEHSFVDPKNKEFITKTRNLTFCNIVTVEEVLKYSPHPENTNLTTLHQEATVTVRNIPLCSKMESIMTDTISKNASKGRVAMEWVIDKIKTEAQELSSEAIKLSQDFSLEAKRFSQDLSSEALKLSCEAKKLSEEAKKHIDSVLPPPPTAHKPAL